jgi:hypothetical protein
MINRDAFLKNHRKRIRDTPQAQFYAAASAVKLLQKIVLSVS